MTYDDIKKWEALMRSYPEFISPNGTQWAQSGGIDENCFAVFNALRDLREDHERMVTLITSIAFVDASIFLASLKVKP